jgi:hypothetical protein
VHESSVPPRRSPLHAALGYARQGIPVLPSHHPIRPSSPAAASTCSCQRRICTTPARHPLGSLTLTDATCETERLAAWWAAHLCANVATPTGVVFDVIQLRHPDPPDQLLNWLSPEIELGPVIWPGPDRLGFLVRPGTLAARSLGVPNGEVVCVSSGTLTLLPPSELPGGLTLSWLRPLGPELPDGERLATALRRLPAGGGVDEPHRRGPTSVEST